MSTETLIGPTGPTPEELRQLRANRGVWALVMSRDLVRGFEPDTLTRATFAHLDNAAKTALAALKGSR